MADQDHEPIYSQLAKIAPTVLYNDPYADDNVEDGWKRFLRSTAEVLGESQKTETLLDEYNQRIQEFQKKIGDRASNIQVSVINPMPEGPRLTEETDYKKSEGANLANKLLTLHQDWSRRNELEIRPFGCLWMCSYPCVVAFSGANKATYLFTKVPSNQGAEALLQ